MLPRCMWALAILLGMLVAARAESAEESLLWVTVIDSESGLPTPARIEVLGADGSSFFPESALAVGGDCRGQGGSGRRGFWNRLTESWQFYTDETVGVKVPPGRYRITATKGIEYRMKSVEVEVLPGPATEATLALTRWARMPDADWYAADIHLHIPRTGPESDATLATWMQAEDLHVATMLQAGSVDGSTLALQSQFGPGAVVRSGDLLLASGQEEPRTTRFGHGIILGGQTEISFPEEYVVYGAFWREAARQGGLSGYAHGATLGARDSLRIHAPTGLVRLIEVINFDRPLYEAFYEALDLGFRVTPTAGSDYPCWIASLPGRERFYTRLDGPLDYDAWLEGIQQGRTFATNGPLLEFQVESAQVGDELELSGPGPIRIEASVRFDPERDQVDTLELIENGQVVAVSAGVLEPGVIQLALSRQLSASAWLAVRAQGSKIGEKPTAAGTPRLSIAHSAPIYVDVAGSPAIGDQLKARLLAGSIVASLGALDEQLSGLSRIEDREDALVLLNGPALREEIARARAHYHSKSRCGLGWELAPLIVLLRRAASRPRSAFAKRGRPPPPSRESLDGHHPRGS